MALVLALPAVMFLLVSTGCGEKKAPLPAMEEDETSGTDITGLSIEQSRVVDEMGYPDHFFISIDPLSSDRIEKWVYYDEGKSLDFDGGHLFAEEAIEDESAEHPPTDLRPQDFDALMTPGEASQLLGEPIYTHEVQDSLMPENTIYVYEKAVLLYRDDQLIGVDTQVSPPQLTQP